MGRKFRKSYALGAAAGAVSGAVYGLILLVIFWMWADYLGMFFPPLTEEGGFIWPSEFFRNFAIFLPPIALVGGMLFGLLFVLLINILPSGNMYIKASSLFFVLWLRKYIFVLFSNPVWSFVTLFIYLLDGCMLAFFYLFFVKMKKDNP